MCLSFFYATTEQRIDFIFCTCIAGGADSVTVLPSILEILQTYFNERNRGGKLVVNIKFL